MSWYEKYIGTHLVDGACSLKPIRYQRQKVVPQASGRILEVGIGTGHNARHYDKSKVQQLCGLDPALSLSKKAQRRFAAAGLPVELLPLSAEQIPADDDSFDTVLLTYTLCSIDQPIKALAEMRRVLKPGGKLLFCEHGKAPDPSVQRWQQRINPWWSKLAGNCHLNRDVPDLLSSAGLNVDTLQQMYIPGPRPFCYNYWGSASAK